MDIFSFIHSWAFFLECHLASICFLVFDTTDSLWCCCKTHHQVCLLTTPLSHHLQRASASLCTSPFHITHWQQLKRFCIVSTLLFLVWAFQKGWLNSIPQGHRIKAINATVFPVTIVTPPLFAPAASASCCGSIFEAEFQPFHLVCQLVTFLSLILSQVPTNTRVQ